MKRNLITRLIVRLATSSLLLLTPITSLAQHVKVFDTTTFIVSRQTVSLQRENGSTSSAEVISEMILLSDGRANGGIGVWELNLANPILYRVLSGKKRGSVYSFTAEQMSKQPQSVTITFQVTVDNPLNPTGTVTFFIDGVRAADGTPSRLMATGMMEKGAASINVLNASFAFVHINAPPQTVEIETATDLVPANFSTTALVFPTVGAMGFLKMDTARGEPTEHFYGTGVYKSIDGGRSWMFAATAENPLIPGDAIMIMIRPHPDPSEPCRIYDILGTQVNSTRHFEAETDITSFKLQDE